MEETAHVSKPHVRSPAEGSHDVPYSRVMRRESRWWEVGHPGWVHNPIERGTVALCCPLTVLAVPVAWALVAFMRWHVIVCIPKRIRFQQWPHRIPVVTTITAVASLIDAGRGTRRVPKRRPGGLHVKPGRRAGRRSRGALLLHVHPRRRAGRRPACWPARSCHRPRPSLRDSTKVLLLAWGAQWRHSQW